MNSIFINGDIVPFTYGGEDGAYYDINMLNNDLSKIDKTDLTELYVDINSFGGDVTTGFAMANILRRFATENNVKIITRVSGYCSSIGTVIFLAGDERIGNEYADFFVHNAWTFAVGDANEMLKRYEDLKEVSERIAKYYSEKTTIPYEEAIELMNNETNIDSDTALKYGFFTKIENAVNAYNSISIRNLLINQKKEVKMAEKKESIFNKFMKILSGSKNLLVYTDTQDVIDFYELEEGNAITTGAKANYNDAPANGTYTLADGETVYTFESGTLTEISEGSSEGSEDEMAKKDQEIADLKAEIESLKSASAKAENEVTTLNKRLNALKELEPLVRAEIENSAKETSTTGAVAKENKVEKINNFKFIR